MAGDVFSFSVKTEQDKQFILQLKQECKSRGLLFSHVVLQALKTNKAEAVGAK